MSFKRRHRAVAKDEVVVADVGLDQDRALRLEDLPDVVEAHQNVAQVIEDAREQDEVERSTEDSFVELVHTHVVIGHAEPSSLRAS